MILIRIYHSHRKSGEQRYKIYGSKMYTYIEINKHYLMFTSLVGH